MGKTIKCPKCGSLNFEAIASSKKSLSLGKGIVGGVLLGPIGAVGVQHVRFFRVAHLFFRCKNTNMFVVSKKR